jgi:hypothetical protein
MAKLEPKVNSAMSKLNLITSMPSPQAIRANQATTGSAMKKIDQATDGSREMEKVDVSHTA